MGHEQAPEPFVSVIIPVYNDTARLRLCLAALERQTYPQDRFEVIIIDNGSDSPVDCSLASTCNVTLLSEPRPGGFAARNTGIERATGEILAFTDADCLPEPEWLETLVAASNGRRVVVAGRIDAFAADPHRPTASERFDMLWGFPQDRFVADGYAASANLAVRRDVFGEVGPYDSGLFSDGDREWCARARALAVPMLYVHGAVVRHPARAKLSAHVTKTRRMAGGVFQRLGATSGRRQARAEMLFHARPPLRRLLHIATGRGLGATVQRLQVAGILLALKAVWLAEWVRLELGGQPERR